MYWFIVIFLLITILIMSTVCPKTRGELTGLDKWAYAHRGLHGAGVPENSLKAFQRAVNAGYGAELDVHLLKDGNLAVIHDSDLFRTTGVKGTVEELTASELPQYYLENSMQTIPTLAEVLEVVSGKTPLIIELKSSGGNYKQLCRSVSELLDTYSGAYCIESFDPRCVHWFRRNRPDVIRGQLAENYFKTPGCKLPFYVKLMMANHLTNFLTYPDFIAYRYQDRNSLFTKLCRKLWGVQGVTWTVATKREYSAAISEGWIPIFENFEP